MKMLQTSFREGDCKITDNVEIVTFNEIDEETIVKIMDKSTESQYLKNVTSLLANSPNFQIFSQVTLSDFNKKNP